ncbi:hypothetical protein FRC01_004076 [Tulasnella sp. 417]|nr:hypothetical protein FRC01_004076 [Tulasnella sp. 417]
MKPSQSEQFHGAMYSQNICQTPDYHRTRESSVNLNGPRFPPQQAKIPAATRPLALENHSLPFNAQADEAVDDEARSRQPSVYTRRPNDTVSEISARSVEQENRGLTTPARSETPSISCLASTAQVLGSSLTLVDRFSSTATLQTLVNTVSAATDVQIIHGQDDVSAVGKAKPTPTDVPISPIPVYGRRPRTVKRSTARRMLDSVRQQGRALKVSIASSLREWGNAAKSLTVRRPAEVERNPGVNPYFDPWEGYVPSRGPSPDLVQTDDDVTPAQSSIWNVYINLDELVPSHPSPPA